MRQGSLPGKWLVHLVAILLLAPILVVVLAPLHTSSVNWYHALQYTLPDQFLGSLRLLFGTISIALLFGTVCAWLVSVFEFPGRRVFKWALVLPLALPTYIAAYIYGDLLGPTGSWSLAIFERTAWSVDIMTETGLMLVMAAVLFPYIYLPARALFSFGSGQLQEAARTLGAGKRMLFFRVGLPLVRPALAGGALLVGMEVLNDYGAVTHFGVQTLTTGIFKSWHNMSDLGTALRIGTVLLVVVFIMRGVERLQRRKTRYAFEPHQVQRTRLLGITSWLAFCCCIIPLTIGALIPLYKIIRDLLLGDHWDKGLIKELFPILGNTLLIALAAAFVAVLIAALFLYARRYQQSKQGNALVVASSLGYVIPGAVIAIGVMRIARMWDDLSSFFLIGTISLLVFALVVRFLAIALETLHAGDSAVERSLDESARVLGAGPIKSFIRINLPLIKNSLGAATILVFIEVIKELPLTLILRPSNFKTLATEAYRFAGIELLEDASVAAAFIVLCSLIPIVMLERQFLKST